MKFLFIITNPNHHLEISSPVIVHLVNGGHQVSVLSLSEMRRMRTPDEIIQSLKAQLFKLEGLPEAKSATDSNVNLGDKDSLKRMILRTGFWQVKLKPLLKKALKGVDRVILFNDMAYPGNRISQYLSNRVVPFFLLQEGIRFPLPTEEKSEYGNGGAQKVLCWGERAKKHFNGLAHQKSQVVAVGNPRADNQVKEFRKLVKTKTNAICIFTNPIDDQGYVSEKEKVAMVGDFVETYADFLNQQQIQLYLKTHPRENRGTYETVIKRKIDRFEVLTGSIVEAIAKVDLGVIMASTVGLELVMANKHVVQLPIAGYGYVFDYVSAGVAMRAEDLNEKKLNELMQSNVEEKAYESYLNSHYTNLGMSDKFIVNELLS